MAQLRVAKLMAVKGVGDSPGDVARIGENASFGLSEIGWEGATDAHALSAFRPEAHFALLDSGFLCTTL